MTFHLTYYTYIENVMKVCMIFRIPLEKQILWHNFGIQKFLFKCHNSCQQTSVHLGCMRAGSAQLFNELFLAALESLWFW